MKIKLIAIAPEDGWAFFSQADNIYLLRPPYTKERLVQVSEDIVEKAIFHHGFESDEISFDNMAELVNYVEERFVEIAKARVKEVPRLEELREILEFADEAVLDRFLTRTENELIPQRAFGPARAIATDLLRLDKIINNPRMRERALDILKKCNFLQQKLYDGEVGSWLKNPIEQWLAHWEKTRARLELFRQNVNAALEANKVFNNAAVLVIMEHTEAMITEVIAQTEVHQRKAREHALHQLRLNLKETLDNIVSMQGDIPDALIDKEVSQALERYAKAQLEISECAFQFEKIESSQAKIPFSIPTPRPIQ